MVCCTFGGSLVKDQHSLLRMAARYPWHPWPWHQWHPARWGLATTATQQMCCRSLGLHWFSDKATKRTWESMQKASCNRVPRRICVLPMTWQFMIIMVPLSELETSTFQSEGVTAHLSICSFQMCSTQQDTFWTSHAARIVCQSLKPGGRIGQYLQNLTDVPFFRLDAIASPEDQEAGGRNHAET